MKMYLLETDLSSELYLTSYQYFPRCVASITCKTKEFTEENNAFCFGADTRSVGTQFCCKEEDELVPKRKCTDFPGRR